MGEVSDYLAPKSEVEPQVFRAHSVSESEAASYLVLLGQLSYSKGSGLKSVKVPTFDGNPDKWPYFWDRIGYDKCFIINRAPTDTCVYNDNKDFRAIITEVYICKIYTTIKQGYI